MVAEYADHCDLLPVDAPDWLRSQPPAIPAKEFTEAVRETNRLSLSRQTVNPYRHKRTVEIKEQYEYWGWMTLEYTLREKLEPDVCWDDMTMMAKANLTLIERELQRRRNIEADSGSRPAGMELGKQRRVDFDALKQRIPIEHLVNMIGDSIGSYGTKDRFKLRCMLPGHRDDHSPSFTVYRDQQSWWCFGCGRGGDVIELARHWFDEPNGVQAAHRLCQFTGVPLPEIEQPRSSARSSNGNHRPPSEPTPNHSNGPTMLGPDDEIITFDPKLFRKRRGH